MRTAADKVKKTGPRKVEGKAVDLEVKAGFCCNCNTDARSRRRTFSEQAWTVLLLWNEINPATVDQPICEECYQEMREILIDRSEEIEEAMKQSDEVARIRQRLSNLAS